MADGRVYSGGGGAPGPNNELNAQFFTPPYLFDSGGARRARPGIDFAPRAIAYGGRFDLRPGTRANVSRVTLVKTGATTHSFNMDQRFLELDYEIRGNLLRVAAPSGPNAATPGYYLLSVIDGDGVVSESRIVTLLNGTAPDSVERAPGGDGTGTTGGGTTTGGTVRENAEDGDTRGWSVYDADPAGATVSNVADATIGSRVIALAGAGRGNGFLVGGTGATSGGWNDRANTVLSWRMNASEGFRAYVALDTARGFRYLQYDPGAGRALQGIYAKIGIGQVPATWRTYTRDLAADLASVEPGNAILAVHGLLLRGNLRVDDIALGRATGGGPVPNRAPTAVAGDDLTATRGRAVRLDGSASSDPDGRIASWRWTDGGGSTLATSAAFDWTPTASGVQSLTLRVIDDRGATATDTVQVRVVEPTSGEGGGALVREDAEDGSTDGWSVYDDDPAGARIANVFDAGAGSRVIDLAGAGVANGFRFEGGWNDAGRTRFSWRMSSSGDAVLYVGVDTTRGFRYLQYDTRGFTGANGIYLRRAVERPGAGWRSYARDLAADVSALEPGNALVAVQNLFVRGRLRLDDVAFGVVGSGERGGSGTGGGGNGTGGGGDGATVRWDAEDGTTTAWDVYDDTPAGARIENVADAAAGSRIVRLSGSGTANGFRLGGTGSGGGSWNDAASEVLSWRMDSPGNYVVYVAARTTKGFRYLTYRPGAEDSLNGIYVQRGLGTTGAGWRTYTRNLASDLAAVDPGNALVSVEGLFVRGSLGVDDVVTRAR